MPACWRPTCPTALAVARKRLAALAERRPARNGSGSGRVDGLGDGLPATGRRPDAGDGAAGHDRAARDRRSRSGSPRPACRRSRGPRGSRSTSTRCAATSRRSASLAGPGVPVHPVVKADAYGHGAVPVARALEAAGADGFCVATLDEALALREGGIRRADPRPVSRSRRRSPGRRRGPGSRVTVGDARRCSTSCSGGADARADAPATRPLGIELEVETGLGRGGFAPEAIVAAASAPSRHARRSELAGLWTHLQAPEDAGPDRDQLDRFDAAATALRRGRRRACPTRHVAASGGLLDRRRRPATASGPGLAIYGLVPDELDGAPLDAAAVGARSGRSCRSTPGRSASPTCRPATAISYGPTFTTAAAEPDRHAAPRLRRRLRAGASRTGPRRSSAAVASRSSGNVAMDASWSTSPTCPARRSTRRRRVRAHRGARAGERITAPRTWRDSAPRTRGRS